MFSFLEYSDWENACKLLKFQISRKVQNRHFNTLSIHAYQNQSIDEFKSESYFERYIKNGLILFCEDVLYSKPFPAPKGTIRYRHWSFLSLQMRLLYYAIGLHISRRLPLLPSHCKVDSRYGANIQNFKEDSTLHLKNSYVYYKKHYQEFYKSALNKVKTLELKPNSAELCVVKMDLENFFEQIDLGKLLNLPYVENAKFPAVPIRLFFSLLTHLPKGLPQTCNDPVGGFLSWLYLKQFDIELATFLEQQGVISDFNVYRYCDDTHVFLYFPRDTEKSIIQEQVATLIDFCKHSLWTDYALRLNSKTVYYHLNDAEQREKYKNSLKSTSRGEEFYIEEDEKTNSFQEMYQGFIESISKYLEHDLLKEDIHAPVKENMKRIYHKGLQGKLANILDQDPSVDLPLELALYKETVPSEIEGHINNLDRAHLVHEPRVFAFFKKYYPEQFKNLLLDAESATNAPSISYQWAICSFGLDEAYGPDTMEGTPYYDRLRELPLYGLLQPETQAEEIAAIGKIVSCLQKNNGAQYVEQCEYLSYFTCQRRVAELTEDFNAAISYLNSECCILLTLLGWEKKKNKKKIPYKLDDYIGVKDTSLENLSLKRNAIDITHNDNKKPKELSRRVNKNDYFKLKTEVFYASVGLNLF